jgi:hypothetical protein
MSAYSGWAESVGAGNVTRKLTTALKECRRINLHVQASYRVWWRWSDTGREWWIELTFRTLLRRPWSATMSGRAQRRTAVGTLSLTRS